MTQIASPQLPSPGTPGEGQGEGGQKTTPFARLAIPFLKFILPAAATLLCYLAAGPTLGLFIGGFFVATFFAPLAPFIATIAIAAVWLIAVPTHTLGQWTQLTAALAAYGFFLYSVSRLAARFHLPNNMAHSLSILIGLAWLTWPLWLSPHLSSSSLIQSLTNLHPPLVANGVLRNEPPWTEKTVAYQLTNLNQDIPISLPTSAANCVGFFAVAGLIFLAAARFRVRSSENRQHPIDPHDE
jgi:hypothetical protein